MLADEKGIDHLAGQLVVWIKYLNRSLLFPLKDKSFMEANVLEYEPHLALFVSDENPFVFYQKIIEEASAILNTNGLLYLEIHEDYAQEIKDIAIQNNFKNVEIRKDLQGKNRMLKCGF